MHVRYANSTLADWSAQAEIQGASVISATRHFTAAGLNGSRKTEAFSLCQKPLNYFTTNVGQADQSVAKRKRPFLAVHSKGVVDGNRVTGPVTSRDRPSLRSMSRPGSFCRQARPGKPKDGEIIARWATEDRPGEDCGRHVPGQDHNLGRSISR